MRLNKIVAMYILDCADGTLCIGVTNSPERRLQQHQEGKNPTAYTYSRRPVKMVYIEYYQIPRYAIAREKQIKGWTHAKKRALINGDMQKLKELAKRRKKAKRKPDPDQKD